MTEEVNPRAVIEAKMKAAQASIPQLEKDLAKAEGVMSEGFPKGTPIGVIVDATGVRNTALGALDGAKADIAGCEKGLQGLVDQEQYERDLAAYEKDTQACRDIVNPFVNPQQKAVLGAKDTFVKAGVNTVITRTELIGGEQITSVELLGPSKPTAPKKGRKSGASKGNGGGRFVVVSPDRSQRLSDREFVALVGPAKIGEEKTAHALATTGGTLYVTARSLQDKAGWTREQK